MGSLKDKADVRWARTRQRLLEGGRKVFARQGVEAASVLEIVRAASVSQPSFYNHFASKDALAREIAAEFFRKDRRAKLKVFDEIDDSAEAIAINVFHTLSIVADDPVIAWVLIKSEPLRALVISGNDDPLADMIKAGIKQGRFCAGNPNTIALAIRGGAFAVMQDILNGTAAADTCRSFQELVLRMLGIAPEESIEVVRRAQVRIELDAVA
jgi:AcrR family transcriptional regulator